MPYEKQSFLAGLAVGRQMKGWAAVSSGNSGPGGSGGTSGTVSVWMDPGLYTHFYIDYVRPLAEMSLSLFQQSTILISTSGVVTPTEIRQISDSIYQIFAPLPQGFIAGYPLKGLNIVQFSDLWVEYSDGVKVPMFSAYLAIDAPLWWTPGAGHDSAALPPVSGVQVSDRAVLTMTGDHCYSGIDSANLPPLRILSGEDSGASIVYTQE